MDSQLKEIVHFLDDLINERVISFENRTVYNILLSSVVHPLRFLPRLLQPRDIEEMRSNIYQNTYMS